MYYANVYFIRFNTSKYLKFNLKNNLIMKINVHAISKEIHKNFSFLPLNLNCSNFASISKINRCQIFLPELTIISGLYPIVLTSNNKENFQIEALFSLIRDVNPFIKDSGEWNGPYLPAFFRCLPFTLVENKEKNDKVLCFFSGTNLINEDKNMGGIPFFKNGEIAEELIGITKTLNAIDKSKIEMHKTINLLKDLDLIIEWDLNIKFDDKEKKVEGIYKIDFEKLNKLSKNEVFELHKAKGFEVAYSQIISSSKINTIANFLTETKTGGRLKKHAEDNKGVKKSLREVVVEKQKKDKALEIDNLVKDLITPD